MSYAQPGSDENGIIQFGVGANDETKKTAYCTTHKASAVMKMQTI